MASATFNPTHATAGAVLPATVELGYTPTPKQAVAHRARVRYKTCGGGRGGGKTAFAAGDAWDLLVSYPGNVGFMGRADLEDLRRSTLKEFFQQDRGLILQHHQTQMWIDVATTDPRHPSRLYYGELKDPDSQLGQNLGFFVIDEGHEVPRRSFDNLCGNLFRLKLPDGTRPPYQGVVTANPFPCWIMDLFPVRREQQRQQREGTWPEQDYGYYPFLAKDNPHNDPRYWSEVLPQIYKNDPIGFNRMVLGIWDDIAEGLVYPFRPYHRWKAPPGTNMRLWRPGTPVSLALDPSGGAAEYAILAIQEIGRYVCVIDCFYEKGAADEEAIDWLRSRPWHDAIADGICDPAAHTTIDRFLHYGYPVRKMGPKKDIRGQILGVKGLLRQDLGTGFAHLLIDENYAAPLCTEFGLYSYKRLSETEQQAGKHSPERPEDKNNHAINALEYWTRDKRPTAHGGGFPRAEPDPGEAPAYYRLLQEA